RVLMSPLKLSLLTALATGLLVSTGQFFARQDRQQEATRLRAENGVLRSKISRRQEQDQLRPAVSPGPGVMTDPAVEGGQPAGALTDASEGPPSKLSQLLKPTYRNAGLATPVAAMQTLAWACDRGNMEVMEKLQIFDPAAREKAMPHFLALPPEIRAQWATPEAMSAALYISDGMHHPYPGAAVIEQAEFQTISPTRVRLHLPGANGNGYEFQLTAEGWKLAVTMAVVDDYIRQSAKPASQP
ncbi:MAG TPA: hypothetical protein VHN79_11835, partial [Lacunisphaera sp.]|nr:hypothetical protein [Lacunisphaera sp.]